MSSHDRGNRPRYHNKKVRERWQEWKADKGEQAFRYFHNTLSAIICLCITGVLLFTVASLPPFGDPNNPTNNEVPRKYIEEGVQDTGAINIVAAMILDYRSFDTFGEACLLFVAVCAILALLRRHGPPDAFDTLLYEMEEPRENVILKTTAFPLVTMIMIFGCFLVLNGHLTPGSGFSGGAILGASLVLYVSAYGTARARTFFNLKVFNRTVSSCLIFYAVGKGYSFYMSSNSLPSGIPLGTPGNLLSAGLIMPLNIAVGLVVACTVYVIYILFSTGEFN